MMSHTVVENVVKQGYLKKGNYGTSRLSGFFRRNDVNKWFVFTVRQGVPFLEYYDSDVDVFTQQPINSFNLSSCQNVKSMGNTNPPSFCIVCLERVIELVASSRTQMVEWVTEVEASLIRLGILKNEVVDHVYTVCPAVVRKPRISKEVTDEQEAETSTHTSGARNSGNPPDQAEVSLPSAENPTPPQRFPLARQKTLIEKSTSRLPLASRTSSSFHGSSYSASVELEPPPPLPQRLPSQIARKISQRGTEESAASNSIDNSYIHPMTEGSNDSDFVSPEVIAELRQQRQALRRAVDSTSQGSIVETTSITPPVISNDTNIVMNKTYFECSNHVGGPSSDSKPHIKSALEPVKISGESANLSCSSILDYESALTLSSSSLSNTPMDNLFKSEEVAENDYSVFPCHQEASDYETSSTDVNSVGGSLVSKPVPVPRKILPLYSSQNDLSSELHPLVNELKDTLTSVISENLSTSDKLYVNMLAHGDDVTNEDEYTNLKQETVENDYDNLLERGGDCDKAGICHPHQFLVKHVESHPSKDENENFYGLVFDNGPPTTMAPPVPAIPPLPPRQNSLQARSDGNKLTVTLEMEVQSFPDAKKSAYFSLPTSAFSIAPSGKHRSLPSDLSSVPPILLPRKSGSNYDCLRKSLPASAFASSGPLEIPPMPPRRTGPHFSLSQDDSPPTLPSRNSQSFFIKRPQITGLSGNTKISSDGTFGQKNMSFTVEEHHVSSESRDRETGAANSASKLSQKMLLDRSHSLHTVVSLKQTQAEILQTEISMTSVAVTINQKAGHGIALVDWNNSPCVVGWNQQDFPSLHGKLHLGDLIFSVNNVKVTSSETAHKLLKQAPASKIEILLHRMPYAKVFAIHRNAEGQNLGIKRNAGTGEILYVDPNGLAAQHGLTNYAPSAFGNGRCSWFLTEINNRPLNLFFKENEIDHRLSAVGREISLVVQPSDFIFEIRRQFKKLRHYKNFITQ